MTPAERKAAERQRRKEAGLVRCEVWVKPEDAEDIRALAYELNSPPTISAETPASIRRNANKASEAQRRAAMAQEPSADAQLVTGKAWWFQGRYQT